MKRIIIILAFMGLFAMPSCDVLDQYPHNATSQDNLSEEDIDLLFVGLYCYSQYKPTFTGYFLNDFAGGDFAMALAAGQLMATIGYIETRVYQVTDTQERYDFSDYYFNHSSNCYC